MEEREETGGMSRGRRKEQRVEEGEVEGERSRRWRKEQRIGVIFSYLSRLPVEHHLALDQVPVAAELLLQVPSELR